MNSSILEQRNRFALIGVLMTIVSLMFLFYMGSSLVSSTKKYLEQIRICNEVLHSCRHSKEIASLVKGFMIESYIEDGAQKIGEGVYGRSITDPCLGWEKSERLIYDIADQL